MAGREASDSTSTAIIKTRRPPRRAQTTVSASSARESLRKFLRYYPGGFTDSDYLDLERNYKWRAHEHWGEALGRDGSAS